MSKRMVPIDKIIGYEGNKYELGVAMIKLAHQMKEYKDIELEKTNGKAAPLAMAKILSGEIPWSYKKVAAEEEEADADVIEKKETEKK